MITKEELKELGFSNRYYPNFKDNWSMDKYLNGWYVCFYEDGSTYLFDNKEESHGPRFSTMCYCLEDLVAIINVITG